LLSGERVLCEGVCEILKHYNQKLEIDSSEIDPNDYIKSMFLTRKIIGYLFMQPVLAFNTLLSLMQKTSNDEFLENLSKLIFKTLAINFTGSIQDRIQECINEQNDKVKLSLQSILDSIDSYLNDLRKIPELKALHPPLPNQIAFRRHNEESVNKSFKEYSKKSVLLSMVTTRTILYGRKSIDYGKDAKGKLQRIETPLIQHSVGMEYPRFAYIAEYDVDYLLRIFRFERFKNETHH